LHRSLAILRRFSPLFAVFRLGFRQILLNQSVNQHPRESSTTS
jgi:hypothetical protein